MSIFQAGLSLYTFGEWAERVLYHRIFAQEGPVPGFLFAKQKSQPLYNLIASVYV